MWGEESAHGRRAVGGREEATLQHPLLRTRNSPIASMATNLTVTVGLDWLKLAIVTLMTKTITTMMTVSECSTRIWAMQGELHPALSKTSVVLGHDPVLDQAAGRHLHPLMKPRAQCEQQLAATMVRLTAFLIDRVLPPAGHGPLLVLPTIGRWQLAHSQRHPPPLPSRHQ